MIRDLLVVLPAGVADATRPSGGNAYDRRVCRELAGLGWRVRTAAVPGDWPTPDPADAQRLAAELAAVPDGAPVLVDGLVGCGVPEVLVPAAARLRLAVLVHLPLADETGLDPAVAAELDRRERAVLAAAAVVVVTGRWAADRLTRPGGALAAAPDRVHVAEPGVDPAPPAPGSADGGQLLCLASVTRRKAQDVLVAALAGLGPEADPPVRCALVGPLPDADYAAELRAAISAAGLTGHVTLTGPLAGAELDAVWSGTDLAVLVSWAETYGMVVTEALARGIPVMVSDAGALPDTLGRAPDGSVPGLVVPAGRSAELTSALRRWTDDPQWRAELRRSAAERRCILGGWEDTARRLHRALDGMARRPRTTTR